MARHKRVELATENVELKRELEAIRDRLDDILEIDGDPDDEADPDEDGDDLADGDYDDDDFDDDDFDAAD